MAGNDSIAQRRQQAEPTGNERTQNATQQWCSTARINGSIVEQAGVEWYVVVVAENCRQAAGAAAGRRSKTGTQVVAEKNPAVAEEIIGAGIAGGVASQVAGGRKAQVSAENSGAWQQAAETAGGAYGRHACASIAVAGKTSVLFEKRYSGEARRQACAYQRQRRQCSRQVAGCTQAGRGSCRCSSIENSRYTYRWW